MVNERDMRAGLQFDAREEDLIRSPCSPLVVWPSGYGTLGDAPDHQVALGNLPWREDERVLTREWAWGLVGVRDVLVEAYPYAVIVRTDGSTYGLDLTSYAGEAERLVREEMGEDWVVRADPAHALVTARRRL